MTRGAEVGRSPWFSCLVSKSLTKCTSEKGRGRWGHYTEQPMKTETDRRIMWPQAKGILENSRWKKQEGPCRATACLLKPPVCDYVLQHATAVSTVGIQGR